MVVKKWISWLGIGIFLAVVSGMVFATTQKVILDVPGSFVLNGKNISVIGLGNGMIGVDIDGVLKNVFQDKLTNELTFVNGVYIQIIAISKTPARVVLNVTVNINCGNNACEVGEDFAICCADCGCSGASQVCSGNRCIENITRVGAKHQCYSDADCDDKNSCTTEQCDATEFPNKCVRMDVSACVAGDQCCPKLCDTDQDADCAQIDKCDTDEDCVDSEACTQETCAGAPKRCQHAQQEGCTYQDQCIVKGTVKDGKYCEGKSHEWILQKVDKQACATDFECISAICDAGVCGDSESKILTYAFYTIGLIAVIMAVWSFATTRKTKPRQ